VFLPAVLSGLLLWTAFYPLDLGLTAFVALVPWLTLVRAEGVSRRRRYGAAYLGGLAFFLPALQWIRVAHPTMYASWIGLSFYCAAYWPLALFLLRRLDRLGRPPLAITLPVVWVALEYARAHFPTGFPFLRPLGLFQLVGFGWYFLGHALHGYAQLIQTADLGGAYVVTAFVAAVNGTVYEWAVRLPAARRGLRWPAETRIGFFREMWTAALAVTLLIGTVIYGTNQLLHPDAPRGPLVAALQADIPQDVKAEDGARTFREYDRLCRESSRADLVVWPETCCPQPWYAVGPGGADPAFAAEAAKAKADFAAYCRTAWRTNVLLGLSGYEADGPRVWQYNSALLVRPDGTFDGPYHKMHLVPFGEYVPLRGTFPWLQALTPYEGDYSNRPGDRLTRFALNAGGRRWAFGVLICYEDSDPYLARQYVAGDASVDFLVNISNDGWFHGWEEHEQHLAVCQFRAIEARRPVVRAVNVGISAIIDADGRVQALPGDTLRGSKGMTGTVTDRLKLDSRPSLYARYGDWLPAGCWAAIAVGLVAARVRRGPVSGAASGRTRAAAGGPANLAERPA
jgi:apolipoprotein N-acyltransferase